MSSEPLGNPEIDNLPELINSGKTSGIRGRVFRNVAWNWTGVIAESAVAFLVTPALVNGLGDWEYGLWILIGSLAGYCGLLDLGLRVSVGRHVALYLARGDRAAVVTVLSTATLFLAAMGLLTLCASPVFLACLDRLTGAPAASLSSAHVAMLLALATLSVSLSLATGDAALWGLQRFDLFNGLDVIAALSRLVGILAVLRVEGGLPAIALTMLAITFAVGILKLALAAYLIGSVPLSAFQPRLVVFRELLNYSAWNFIGSVASLAKKSMGPLLIGALLGVASVTPFALASRLLSYAATLVVAAAGAVTPLATALHAEAADERQKRLLFQGSRLCVALACCLTSLLFFLGRPLLRLWIGPRMAEAADLTQLLAAGEFLPLSQLVLVSVLLGKARHQLLGWLNVLELVMIGLLAAALAPWLGLLGVCLALAISATVSRGILPIVYGCYVLGIGLREYLRNAWSGAFYGILLTVILGCAVHWYPPQMWAELILFGGVYTLMFIGLTLGFEKSAAIARSS